MTDQDISFVYNFIAKEFSDSRQRVWPYVQKFISTFQDGTLNADIGCGNGKNMIKNDKYKIKGMDICKNFVKICKEKDLDVVEGNMLNIPFEENLFDNTMCVAVIHHFKNHDDRVKAIQELIRITKNGGKILISVWALEQPDDTKRKFTEQDNIVPFKKHNGEVGQRFYHVYRKEELESDCKKIFNVTIKESMYEKGNWFIILEKNL